MASVLTVDDSASVRQTIKIALTGEGYRVTEANDGVEGLFVRAVHTGEGWVARFRFSFLSDVTGLYRFRRRGRGPTTAALDRMAEAIVTNLPACREGCCVTHGSRHEVGLINRRIETTDHGRRRIFWPRSRSSPALPPLPL